MQCIFLHIETLQHIFFLHVTCERDKRELLHVGVDRFIHRLEFLSNLAQCNLRVGK